MATLNLIVAFLKAIILPVAKITGEKRECIIGAYVIDIDTFYWTGVDNDELWDMNKNTWNELFAPVHASRMALPGEMDHAGCDNSYVRVNGVSYHANLWVPPMGEIYRVESGLYEWVIDDIVITIKDSTTHPGQYRAINWARLAA